MTIEAMIANQIRIERQEQPTVASVSFDIHAANTFQSYVRAAMAFSIKRGGVLYGTVDDNDNIKVNESALQNLHTLLSAGQNNKTQFYQIINHLLLITPLSE